VSGMHRSGISELAGVVSLLGAASPDRQSEGDDEREDGHAVLDLDERVLERFGSWSAGWDTIDGKELRSRTRLVERGRRLVRSELAGADLIVLKDPRISRLLPLWTTALEKEGFRCVHVVALHRPDAVAASLGGRDGLSTTAVALSWLAHSLDAELHTRAQARVVVAFENLLRDWRAEVARVSRALAVEWPRPPDDVADAVEELIEPGPVHEPPASAAEGPVADVTPVYDVLRRWSEDDSRPGDADLLDAWRRLLEPVRGERSAVAGMSLARREVVADLETRNRPVGPLGSPQVWDPIRYEGHNLEAAAAWAWLMRERHHDRGARRSAQQITRLRRSLAEPEPSRRMLPRASRRMLPRALRRLRRRWPPPALSRGRSRSTTRQRRAGGNRR
jgi:hypothetical protein